MGISRLHFALLSIMSIFTGIIAPGTSTRIWSIAYPMTDAKVMTYILLLFLVIGFYTASIHSWRYFRYNAILIFGMIGLLFFLTISGQITETKNGLETSGISWGWIFLITGVVLLMRAYRGEWHEENASELRQTIDTLLGIVGSFTLACIAGIIVLISLSISEKNDQGGILERILGSGSMIEESGGITVSHGYKDVSFLSYDRKTESLLAILRDNSGTIATMRTINGAEMMSWSLHDTIFTIGGRLYRLSQNWHIFSGSEELHDTVLLADDTLLTHSGSDWNIRSNKASWAFDYSGSIDHPIISGDHMTISWIVSGSWWDQIYRMGKVEWITYRKVYSLDLSAWWYDLMALVGWSGSLEIVKNGKTLWKVDPWYITGSYISNGSHSIYRTKESDRENIIYDGQSIEKWYEDIREVFLEKNGWSYSYFARHIGERTYCLFTRYKGNICGLEGYMNPRVSADGSSIIYAGLQDGVWNIYRNTEIIARNTNYSNEKITDDYAFYDLTNPRTYLFVKKDPASKRYTLIKNGKVLPWLWNDFGTDVSFGYDNHILLRVKEGNEWKILEV